MANNGEKVCVSFRDGNLSIVGQDLEHIDESLIEKYAATAVALDLSYNSLTEISPVSCCTKLKRLVLDNNALQSLSSVKAPLEHVELLSLNNNSFEDLQDLIQQVKVNFPNVRHLSLLKNPCCPSDMLGGNHDDYVNYRYAVLAQLPTLKILDTQKVTPKELVDAKKRAAIVKKGAVQSLATPAAATSLSEKDALPTEPFSGRAGISVFGKTAYVYQGKQSEGNRFIRNDDL